MRLLPIVYGILKEQEVETSNVNDMLNKFKVLKYVLEDLLTSSSEDQFGREDDLTKLVSGIEIIVFKPTTFLIKFKNGSKMTLKYDPTPRQLKPTNTSEYKARDYFQLQIMGKKYDLGNRSEYLQALDYISQALSHKPIGAGDKEEEPSDNNAEDIPEPPDEGGEQEDNDEE